RNEGDGQIGRLAPDYLAVCSKARSMIRRNESGASIELANRKRAPLSESSRRVQGSVERRSLQAMIAPFRTRRRGDRRFSALSMQSLSSVAELSAVCSVAGQEPH